MNFIKKNIRTAYQEKRMALDNETWDYLNAGLLIQCQELDLQDARMAHLFLPIVSRREVDTYRIAAWLRDSYPDLQLALSRSYLATGSMSHYLWEEQTRLVENRYGIPEPESGRIVMPSELDVVFVPMLAFDLRGHRVGYGKGMYDEFLSQCRPECRKIGLNLFEPLEGDIEDTYANDVALDMVVTPYRKYEFF